MWIWNKFMQTFNSYLFQQKHGLKSIYSENCVIIYLSFTFWIGLNTWSTWQFKIIMLLDWKYKELINFQLKLLYDFVLTYSNQNMFYQCKLF
jgi:hypothetical protein